METLVLNHLEFGAGPPLVVLHGLFGSARNWAGTAKILGDTYRVFALDLRNHGGSPWADDMSFAAMAADVARFFDDHGLTRPVVMGHSLGGKAAMTLALDRPETVGALIVVDVAPVAYRHTLMPYVEVMRGLDLSAVERRSDADRALAASVPEPAVRQFLLQNLVLGDGSPRWRINLAAIAAAVADGAAFTEPSPGATYGGPTLFVSGGRSAYVRGEHHPVIRRLFPAAQFQVIAGAGHWVHAERPQEFIAAVQAFLDGV